MGVQGDRVDHHSSRENTRIEDFFENLILLQSQFVYESISPEDFGLRQRKFQHNEVCATVELSGYPRKRLAKSTWFRAALFGQLLLIVWGNL